MKRSISYFFIVTMVLLLLVIIIYSQSSNDTLQETMHSLTGNVEVAWVRHYAEADSINFAIAIVVDGLGNVYVTGESNNKDFFADYATIKYDTDGIERWVARYDGPEIPDDKPIAIAVDGAGNIYVTGISDSTGTSSDYTTVKYSNDGVEQWLVRYNSPANSSDRVAAMLVDGSGNVYVTGESLIPVGEFPLEDYATVKYNTDGAEEWVARYSNGIPAAIALDNSGNAYVTGMGNSGKYTTVKYDTDGVEQWVAIYDGPGHGTDRAKAIVIDTSNNVYVTGSSQGSGTSADYTTVKYNTDGVEQWVAIYNGPGNSNDNAIAMAVDGSGNVYVTGDSWGLGDSADYNAIDYATVKYDTDGVEQWVARYTGTGSSVDVASKIAIDNSGNAYVTGRSDGKYITIKYSTVGVEQWVAIYEDSASISGARDIAVDEMDNVYVTGTSIDKGLTWSTYTTIKYVQTPISVEEEEASLPAEYILMQNYPNPFNPLTTIRYSLPKSGMVVLSIYSLLGEELVRLEENDQPAGNHLFIWDASNFASGIYFYRLQAGDFVQTRKMLLLK